MCIGVLRAGYSQSHNAQNTNSDYASKRNFGTNNPTVSELHSDTAEAGISLFKIRNTM